MDVLMPQLGETVAEGKITKWFKAAGDAVKPGDNLFEIETDKTSMEVPATSAGVLTTINVQVGEVVKVGAVVAVISGAGEAPAQVRHETRAGGAAAPPVPQAASAPAPKPQAPFVPAKAGTQPLALDSRLRGNERVESFAYPNLDPFFEVRTPSRNYGP